MRIGLCTDNDFGKTNGLTTTLPTTWRCDRPMVGSFDTLLAEYAEVLSGSRRLGRLMRSYQRWLRPLRDRAGAAGGDADRFTPERRSGWNGGVNASWAATCACYREFTRGSLRVCHDGPRVLPDPQPGTSQPCSTTDSSTKGVRVDS